MSLSVLVVDDTDHVRTMLADMLVFDGYAVVGSAATSEQAVQLTSELRPDVVVMDLRMPRVDGLESTRLIRELIPQQVVVLYTAFLDPEICDAAAASGVTACVGKGEGLPALERELDRLALR